MVTKEHGRGGIGVAVLGEEGDKTEFGQDPRLGKTRHSFEHVTSEDEGFAVGVSEER